MRIENRAYALCLTKALKTHDIEGKIENRTDRAARERTAGSGDKASARI